MTSPAPPAYRHPLIEHLLELARRDDRGALAALRRGLGKPPGAAPEMFPYVEPFIPASSRPEQEAAAYLVASLFGLHPYDRKPAAEDRSRARRGLGTTLAAIRLREGTTDEDEGVSRRFGALLNSDRDGLPTHLRHVMTLLDSRMPEAPIDFNQLYIDITQWDEPDHRVQRAWAAGFWRRTAAPSEPGNDAIATTTSEE